jgi:ribosomal protein S12 methylthiotransferase accessory factor
MTSAKRDPMRIEINAEIKYQPDTQRVFDYETTLSNIENIFSDIGVTELKDITHLDRVGVPVVSATRPSAGRG